MKKLLGILVLGLFFSNIVHSQESGLIKYKCFSKDLSSVKTALIVFPKSGKVHGTLNGRDAVVEDLVGEYWLISDSNGIKEYLAIDKDILFARHMYTKSNEDRFSIDKFWAMECVIIENTLTAEGDPDSKDGLTSGTAFFINSKGYLITNHHVVKGCKLSKINYFNKEYDAKLISTDKTLDLALLKVDVKPKSYITFSKNEPKKRQQIIVAGYPLGKGLSDDLKINDGRISSLKGFENNSNEITVDVAINPGNSGGPIVNHKGQLVAIAVSGMSKDVTEGINFGIKTSAASNFLKSNKINPSEERINFSMDDDKLVQLLEESTVYTFCN